MIGQFFRYSRLSISLSFVGVSMVILLIPPAILLYSLEPHRRIHYFGYFWKIFTKIVLKVGVSAKITAIDRRATFHSIDGRGLVISNHLSMVDIPLMAEHHIVVPIMKKEVAEIPLFGKIIQVVSPITVDRRDPGSRQRSFKECIRRMKMGWPVQSYPEGTRSKDGIPKPLDKIYPRLIMAAYEYKIPVTPVSLYGTDQILTGQGEIRLGKKIGIITHEEVWPQDYDDCDEFVAHVWDIVLGGYNELDKMLKPTS